MYNVNTNLFLDVLDFIFFCPPDYEAGHISSLFIENTLISYLLAAIQIMDP